MNKILFASLITMLANIVSAAEGAGSVGLKRGGLKTAVIGIGVGSLISQKPR